MRLGARKPGSSTALSLLGMASRAFFPAVLLLWFLLFAFARNPQHQTQLRGADDPSAAAAAAAGDKRGTALKPPTQPKNPSAASQKAFPAVVSPRQLSHAVIVAGHAVLRISKLASADRDDGAWYLLKYQLNQGFPGIIASHIKRGVQIAAADSTAMLLFSGGQTRLDVGPTSEAASYYYLAQHKQWLKPAPSAATPATALGSESTLVQRTYLEEHARDSYENLLFSLCRFREVAGHYPTRVTVVGFDFKQERFSSLHRRAIGFPAANFSYVGLRPQHSKFDHAKAARGEKEVLKSFHLDLYACTAALSEKKDVRNPFRRTVPYPLACPELGALLAWCGPELIAASALPW